MIAKELPHQLPHVSLNYYIFYNIKIQYDIIVKIKQKLLFGLIDPYETNILRFGCAWNNWRSFIDVSHEIRN